eukprot:2146534-Pleurochrysis_carterae.AAC.1
MRGREARYKQVDRERHTREGAKRLSERKQTQRENVSAERQLQSEAERPSYAGERERVDSSDKKMQCD